MLTLLVILNSNQRANFNASVNKLYFYCGKTSLSGYRLKLTHSIGILWVRPSRYDSNDDWTESEQAARSKAAAFILEREVEKTFGKPPEPRSTPNGFFIFIAIGMKLKMIKLVHDVGPIDIGEEQTGRFHDHRFSGYSMENGVDFADAGEYTRVLKDSIHWEQVGEICNVLRPEDRPDLEAKLRLAREISRISPPLAASTTGEAS